MNLETLKNKLEFIASEESDKEHYQRSIRKVGMAFKEVADGVYQAGIYFIIEKCLYRKKDLHQLELNFK